MPVNENSYQNGKVYRIWSLDTNDIYVGSSSDTLSNRFCRHKSDYKKWKEGDKTRYCSSSILFDLVGVDNCKIELIKNFPCNSKAELNREEGRIMRENKDIIVNRKLAGRTQKDWFEDNKEQITQYKKEYYEHNKKEISEKTKEYREVHKKEIYERTNKYKKEHKEQLQKKYDCECGGKFTHSNKTQHEKTQKHQDYLKSQ